MTVAGLPRHAPATAQDAAGALKEAADQGTVVRFVAGATKSGWGTPTAPADVELSTEGLDRIVEHNDADFTAVLEAGLPLAEASRRFATAGQMLALDPPLGAGEAATVGGVFATADSGPLRHRYGAPRDLIVGATLALSDGTVAKTGGKVIKNVAGYDLAKLFAGAFGTLGAIVTVSVRLHPVPEATATAVGEGADPEAVSRGASALAHSPLEADCLDVRWSDGAGGVLARFGGAAAGDQAEAAIRALNESGEGLETRLEEYDDQLWSEQRERQRSAQGAVIKVSALQARLPDVLRAAEQAGGAVVGRAAHGLAWLTLPSERADELVATIERLRTELAPSPCVVRDAPVAVREALDVWDEDDRVRLELSRRLKARFDPAGVCNRGVFVGGI